MNAVAAPAPRRPWFRTKADWAAAEAAKYREQINALPTVSVHDSRGIAARMRTIEHLRREAQRMEKIAQHYRARGE